MNKSFFNARGWHGQLFPITNQEVTEWKSLEDRCVKFLEFCKKNSILIRDTDSRVAMEGNVNGPSQVRLTRIYIGNMGEGTFTLFGCLHAASLRGRGLLVLLRNGKLVKDQNYP